MKKILCVLLMLSLLLPLLGCTKQEADVENPVNFYYRRNSDSLTFGYEDSVIVKEVRSAGSHPEDFLDVLSLYFKGPETDGLNRTFPKSVVPLSIRVENDAAFVTLSDFFSTLTGMDLTVACACLTMTVGELTGVAEVTVSTESTLLDGNRSVTMRVEDVLLLDSCDIIVDPQ